MRLKDKAALVTGATAGLGQSIAEAFAREGAAVLVTGRDAARGEAVVEGIRSSGGRARFRRLDVTAEEEVEAAVAATVDEWGRLDVVVNNAGYYGPASMRPLAELPVAEWDRVIQVNLRGPFLVCRAAIPAMIRQGGGAIVSIASIRAIHCSHNLPAYTASKAALIQMTKSIALDYGAQNIRANAILPGVHDTPGGQQSYTDREEYLRRIASLTPLGRIGHPSGIAYAAVFLASDEAAYITGATLVVDGGRIAGEYRPHRSGPSTRRA
ncbi:MAG: SDR family oxidoreductase [Chloroflexi bacterium]|nr:SDR family oxidoreductase [Chloroflexota bacterium]